MTLCVIHPEKPVREALARTLAAVWPEIEIAQDATAPEKPAKDALYLAPKNATLPAAQMIALEGQSLKSLVQAAQMKYRALTAPRELALGSATLDTATRDFTQNGATVSLTEKEAAILVYLSRRDTPATRDDLLRDVWQYANGVDTHTIETHIYRLRQKIEADPEKPKILLTKKDGYQLAAASKA